MKKDQKLKIVLLFSYVILSCMVVYFLKPVYLSSILIVLGPPSIVNFLWLKKSRFKVLLFAILSALIFAPPVELMAMLANVWDVQTVLPRFFGYISFENMLFAFLNFFWVLSFYEYFIDRDTSKKISSRLKYLVVIYVVLVAIVFSLFFYNKNLITMSYHTLSVVILLIPAIAIFSKYPRLLRKVVVTTVFFALVFFVYEIMSIAIGSWWWPGEYLLPLNVFGHTFPLDDVIIWYLLSTPVLIGGYEFFADDGK